MRVCCGTHNPAPMPPETPSPDALPQATVVPRQRSRLSIVWIVPIFAVLVAVGIAVQRVLAEGPTITIIFKAAGGIEAGKTPIKYKDVTIGQVSTVELTPDYQGVVVTARMARSAEGLMVDGARFWIVSPQIGLSGVSGLSTLLSGNYIGFEAATGTGGQRQRRFTALDQAPVVSSTQPGRTFKLKAANPGSLNVGSPVYFRRLRAGQVTAIGLAPDGQTVTLDIFVEAPFDRYVTIGTRFWNASGIDLSLTANGLDVRTESLVALLAGGVAFETPSFVNDTQPAAAGADFTLFADQVTAMKQPDPHAMRYVLYFDDSLRGLSVGAPVTLLGLTGGAVTDVGLEIDPATARVRGRVELVAYPERIGERLDVAGRRAGQKLLTNTADRHALIRTLVERRGLRGQLRSGNLLTGQMYVAFEFFPGAPRASVDWRRDPVELPVMPSALGDLESRLSSILAKIDALPWHAVGGDLQASLASFDRLMRDTDQVVRRLDAELLPTLKPAVDAFRRAAESAERALQNTDANLLSGDAPAQQELRQTLQEVGRAARSLRVLADYLEMHPESLIRGKSGAGP